MMNMVLVVVRVIHFLNNVLLGMLYELLNRVPSVSSSCLCKVQHVTQVQDC